MKRRRFTSKAEKSPGNRLLPDHFQTALSMLHPDSDGSVINVLHERETFILIFLESDETSK